MGRGIFDESLANEDAFKLARWSLACEYKRLNELGLYKDATTLVENYRDSRHACIEAGLADAWLYGWLHLRLLGCAAAAYYDRFDFVRATVDQAFEIVDHYEDGCMKLGRAPDSWMAIKLLALKAWGNLAWLCPNEVQAGESEEMWQRLTMCLALQSASGPKAKQRRLQDSATAMVLKGILRSSGLDRYKTVAFIAGEIGGFRYPSVVPPAPKLAVERKQYVELCLALACCGGASEQTIRACADIWLSKIQEENQNQGYTAHALQIELGLALARRATRAPMEML